MTRVGETEIVGSRGDVYEQQKNRIAVSAIHLRIGGSGSA